MGYLILLLGQLSPFIIFLQIILMVLGIYSLILFIKALKKYLNN